MKSSAFQLDHSFDHVVDDHPDAELFPFTNSNFLGARMMTTRSFELPSKLYGRGNLESLNQSDFPLVSGLDCVVSLRMWSILNAVNTCDAHFHPLTIIDEQYLEEPFEESGDLKAEIPRSTDFGIVQVLSHPEVLDYQASEIIMDKDYPEDISFIKKVVLKEPQGGFPSIFRIPEKRRFLFVSSEAKTALEEAGIQRCIFKPIETSS